MKAFKYVAAACALVVVLFLGATFVLFGNLNEVIKIAIETIGPRVTETTVTVDKVDVKVSKGRGELLGFHIGNPEGFEAESLFDLEKIALEFTPSSVTQDVLWIKEITIEGMLITAEQKGKTTNIQELIKTLQGQASGAKETPKEEAVEGEEQKMIIEKLRFVNNAIDFRTEKLGSYNLPFPSIELEQLGEAESGLTPEQLGREVVMRLLKQAQDSITKKSKDLLKNNEKVQEIKNKAEDVAKKELEKHLGDDAEEKVKSLKKLFK